MKMKRKSGFTMIELLVVISIIGILTSVLIPSVSSMMLSGKTTELSQRGKKIVDAIITAELRGNSYVWPATTYEADAEETDSNKPNLCKTFSTTEEYFQEALLLAKDAKTRLANQALKDITTQHLVGDGMVEAASSTLNANNCAWRIAQNVGIVEIDMPALVSKNLKAEDLVNTKGNTTNIDADKLLDATKKPFGKKACVLVTKQGKPLAVNAADMTASSMGLRILGDASMKDMGADGADISFLKSK